MYRLNKHVASGNSVATPNHMLGEDLLKRRARLNKVREPVLW